MRITFLHIFVLLFSVTVYGQSTCGLSGIPNNSVEVKTNPGFAWLEEDRAHITIGSLSGAFGGNSFSLNTSPLHFLTKGTLTPGEQISHSGGNGDKSFMVNANIGGPGIVFKYHKFLSFGISTGVRYIANSDGLDSKVLNLLGVGAAGAAMGQDSLTIRKYSGAAQVFEEINLTYAGFVMQNDTRKLIAGGTLKLLNGMGAAGLNVNQAGFSVRNNDGVAYGVNGSVDVAFSPFANRWLLTSDPFSANANHETNFGVGADFGLVYYSNPYRGFRLHKGYKTRLAISITDVGSISYNASSTSASYDIAGKNINYRALSNAPNTTFGNVIFNNYIVDSVATSKGGNRKFSVGLPTALHIDGDFKLNDFLFLNANVLVDLRSVQAHSFSNHYISTATITPRMNFGYFTLAVPVSYNILNQFSAGAVVMGGYFYIGSSTMFSNSILKEKQAFNVFTGLMWKIKPHKLTEEEMMMM